MSEFTDLKDAFDESKKDVDLSCAIAASFAFYADLMMDSHPDGPDSITLDEFQQFMYDVADGTELLLQ